MARKTKEDWLRTGVTALIEAGPDGLTVDGLCRRLDVTKGSFYHHFDGYDDFKMRLLAYFEQEGTLNIIDVVEETADTPQARLHRLLDIIVRHSRELEHNPEVVVRAWARQDEAAAAVQTRVDRRRIAYVESLCQQLVGDAETAKRMAQLLYAILVGCEQLQPPVQGDGLRALFDEYLRFYQVGAD